MPCKNCRFSEAYPPYITLVEKDAKDTRPTARGFFQKLHWFWNPQFYKAPPYVALDIASDNEMAELTASTVECRRDPKSVRVHKDYRCSSYVWEYNK